MTENQLSQTYTPKKVLLYALPTLFTMIFMGFYMIVDGIFVAVYVDEYAFSAINIVYPLISANLALSLMLSTGSSAIIGKFLGENQIEKARSFFTQIYCSGIIQGVIITLLCLTFPNKILEFLQTTDSLYPYSYDYLVYYALFFIPAVLQVFAQTFLIANGTPVLGFILCFLGGITNIILDYIFIAKLQLGIKGAAIATGLGFAVPGIGALLYFAFHRQSLLHFTKFNWDFPLFFKSCFNGASEFVTNLAISITTFLFNIILLEIAGEAGVASITAILYIQMIQMGLYMGLSFGVSPLISFKYGANEPKQLQLIIKTSFIAIGFASLLAISLSFLCGDFFMELFIPPDSETFPIARRGLNIYAISYIFMGLNVFLSAMFTALSNGKISAILSFTRTLFLLVFFLITLPHFFHIDGVWLAVPIAESISALLSIYFYKKYKPIYHY